MLSYRSAGYTAADELCCPTHLEETTLRWDRGRKRFFSERRMLDQEPVARAPAAPPPAPAP